MSAVTDHAPPPPPIPLVPPLHLCRDGCSREILWELNRSPCARTSSTYNRRGIDHFWQRPPVDQWPWPYWQKPSKQNTNEGLLVCLSTITAKYISLRSFLLKPLNKGMFPIVQQICCRCYLAVGRDTNKEDSWTIELASQGGLTMPRIYVKCTHKCYTNVLTNIDIFDIIIGYWSTSIVNGF